MRQSTVTLSPRSLSVLFFRLLCDELTELREDLVLALRAFLVVEFSERTFLIGAVDLVLLTQTHRFHTPMSAANNV